MFWFFFLSVSLLFSVSVDSYRGPLTWFRTGLSACNFVSQDGDPIVASPLLITPENKDGIFNCGTKIKLTDGIRTTFAYITDHCRSCEREGLDGSPSVHLFFSSLNQNPIVTWEVVQDSLSIVGLGAYCGDTTLCSGSDIYCVDQRCVKLPPRPHIDILVGGPGFPFEQCSGAGFPKPLICPPDFTCTNMTAWDRPDMGQCLKKDSQIGTRPDYLGPAVRPDSPILAPIVESTVSPSMTFSYSVSSKGFVRSSSSSTTSSQSSFRPTSVVSSTDGLPGFTHFPIPSPFPFSSSRLSESHSSTVTLTVTYRSSEPAHTTSTSVKHRVCKLRPT